MRVSTNMFQIQGISALQDYQQEMLQAQQNMNSGKAVEKASDNPMKFGEISSISTTLKQLDVQQNQTDRAKGYLSETESILESSINTTQRARDIAVQMASGTFSKVDREAAAAELNAIIDEVLSLTNYTNSQGENHFSGTSTKLDEVFIKDTNNPGYYTYIGGENAKTVLDGNGVSLFDNSSANSVKSLQLGFYKDRSVGPGEYEGIDRVQVTENGGVVFGVDNPKTARVNTEEGNLINTLVTLRDTLNNGEPTPDGVLSDIDTAISAMTEGRASVGSRLNRLELLEESRTELSLALIERKSVIEDIDMVEGITRLTQAQQSLDMAQQVFAKVTSLSLFDKLY
jgi:flagellar hook-associated protein 3 FlgL